MHRPAGGGAEARPQWHGWRGRLGWPTHLVLAVLAVAVVAPAAVGSYRQNLEAGRQMVVQVASLKASWLDTWLKERGASAGLSGTSFPQAEMYAAWQRDGDTEARDRLVARLGAFADAGSFSGVTLLDPTGRVLWSQGAHVYEPGEVHKVGGSLPQRGAGVVVWSYRDARGEMHIDFVVALPTEGTQAGPSVVYHASPADMLVAQVAEWVPSAQSGRVVFARRIDDDVHAFWLEGIGRDAVVRDVIVPVAAAAVPIVPAVLAALDGAPSVREGRDRDGVRVVAAGREAGDTGWVAVARIERGEVIAAVVPIGLSAALAAVVVYLAAAYALARLRRQQQAAVTRGAEAAEAERRRALRLLAAVADALPDAIFAKDLEGRYTLVNRAGGALLGRHAADALGRTDHELFPAAEAAVFEANDHAAVRQGHAVTFEECVDSAAGRRVYLSTKGPLEDGDGHVTGTYGISRDITERRADEEALADQAASLRAALGDLGRFNRVLVDREIAMVDLKRRVNAYAARLGEAPPFVGEALDEVGGVGG